MSPSMLARAAALALAVWAEPAATEPVVVASGSYPEGLLWDGTRMFFAEMGGDRISIIENGATRLFWRELNCGPTSVARFGTNGFVVNCHLSRQLVEVSADGLSGRRFRFTPEGTPLQDPNASAGDGQGGVFFSDSGIFDRRAPATGRVYHLSATGTVTEIMGALRYANGVAFDVATRTLYVSEHLARRVLALTLDSRHRVLARKILIDFSQHDATRTHGYPLAGPDGLALQPGLLAVAEYGEGRVHLFDRGGGYRRTLRVPMPFVDTVAWDGRGNLYAGGSFQNIRPPFEGAVVRLAPDDWQRDR